jgi:hypothetical protein
MTNSAHEYTGLPIERNMLKKSYYHVKPVHAKYDSQWFGLWSKGGISLS